MKIILMKVLVLKTLLQNQLSKFRNSFGFLLKNYEIVFFSIKNNIIVTINLLLYETVVLGQDLTLLCPVASVHSRVSSS